MIYTKHTWKHLNTRRSLSLTSHLGLFIRCSFSAENIHFFLLFQISMFVSQSWFLFVQHGLQLWLNLVEISYRFSHRCSEAANTNHIQMCVTKKTQRNCKTTEVNLFHCCTNRRLKYKRLCRSIIHICTITERLLSHTNARLRSFDLLKMTPHVSSRSSLVLYTES